MHCCGALLRHSVPCADHCRLVTGHDNVQRGINLSGGQKQRISIARAMYNDADIYIFDDPLSALDAHVGRHVFQNVISQLVREGKTVVLVTNQLQFVNHADKIVFLKHDKVAQEAWVHEQGSYSELMQNQDFAELMKDVGAGDDEAIERSPKADGTASTDDKSEAMDAASAAGKSAKDGKSKPGGTLTTTEEREQGEVSWDVYRGYLKLAKATSFFIGVVVICWSAQLTSVFNDWWITWWTQQKYDLSNAAYNFIYLLGAIGFSVFTFTNGIFWAQVGMLTAKNIHAELLKSVLAGRMEFFDTTPVNLTISVDPVLWRLPFGVREQSSVCLHLLFRFVGAGWQNDLTVCEGHAGCR